MLICFRFFYVTTERRIVAVDSTVHVQLATVTALSDGAHLSRPTRSHQMRFTVLLISICNACSVLK